MAIYRFEEEKPKKNYSVDYQKLSGVICVVVSILALFCLITHFVPFMKSFLLGVLGLFCYPFFITLMAVGFALIAHKKYVMPKKYGILLVLSLTFVLCILQLILVKNEGLDYLQFLGRCYTQKTTAGGIIIGLITSFVLYPLGRLGAYIIFIALSVIFIALAVDYVHYLGKNEELKKSVKIANRSNGNQNKITVKELEQNLKINKQEEKEEGQEKVKLTLDAKEERESAEEIAKRKLGLLASSNQNSPLIDEKDNKSIDIQTSDIDTKYENIVTSSVIQNNNLDRIQANLLELKNRVNKSSYPISNSTYKSSLSSLGNFSNQSMKNEDSMPNKVLHEVDSFNYNEELVYPKNSVIEGDSVENKQKESIKPIFSFNDEQQDSLAKISQNITQNDSSLDNNNISNEQKDLNSNNNEQKKFVENYELKQNTTKKNLNYEQIEPVFVEDKKQKFIPTLDVEDFTNNVLESLNNENKKNSGVQYYESANSVASRTEFNEEKVKPILPKKSISYVPPPIELLTTQSMDLTLVSDDVVRKREELEMALDTFGIPAKCIGVVVGPAVTRYELEMPAGVSVKRVISLQEDIAYALSSKGDIRIEAPIPGRRAVGIEVPNAQIATVGLRDIILSSEFQESKKSLTVALGKDISNNVKTFNFVKIPHLLVAGTTGSGKSVCINSIILSLIYRFSPDEVKLILVDPKRVEFSMYNNLPHLLMPNVITDSEMALNALDWCVDEMERRYLVFANARVKSMEEYNESEEVLEGKAEKMPYIIFIIDELADLLMTAKKEAEDYIIRILQKARAAGIHMILATQRPSADIVTGKIKANLPARICFALMTFADSRTVLDQSGAEKLLGKGDMLFLSSDTSEPKRIQGCFVTTKEIDNIVSFIKENNPDFDFDIKTEQAILNPKKNDIVSQIDGDRASGDGNDSLMPQVLKAVIENGHASISMIQRKFLVGYPRAARIIDQMESAGFISPADGSKTRSVYITMEEYEKLYGEDA